MATLWNWKPSQAIINILLSVFMFFLLLSGIVSEVMSSPAANLPSYANVTSKIDMTRIEQDIQTLVAFGSRFTGYPGHEDAAEFIYERFVEYGLKSVAFEPFEVTVPYDYGASVTVTSTGEEIKAFALAPNLIETCAIPPEGMNSRLIYVGDGSLSNYYGKNVEGSIALMEFDCSTRWLYSLWLGAKALLFIEDETTASDASSKSLGIPLDFPRLYVRKEDGERLKQLIRSSDSNEIDVNIKSLIVFRKVIAQNIVGIVEGLSLKNEYVVIAAHYDSKSIVPSIAPGAEEACGIATLLELARFFTKPENQPERSIIFLALSGNGQGLAGSREFVYQHFEEVGRKLRLFISLDISSEGRGIAGLYWGTFYGYSKPIPRYLNPYNIKNALARYILNMELELGRSSPFVDLISQSDILIRSYVVASSFNLNSEPFTLAGGIGIGLFTTYSYNLFMGTPFDTYDKLNFGNLESQVLSIAYLMSCFLNDAELVLTEQTPGATQTGGWLSLTGQVQQWNRTRAWYDSVPNALVVLTQRLPVASPTVFAIIMADGNGYYEAHGIQHRNSPESQLSVFYTTHAYLDEPTYGPINYAPDLGKYGAAVYPSSDFTVEMNNKFIITTVFKSGSLILIGISDPTRPSTMFQDVRLDVRLFGSDSFPDYHGQILMSTDRVVAAMIYIEPDERIEIILKPGVEREPFAVLVNATFENPEGYGYKTIEDKCFVIDSYGILKDLYLVNEGRIKEVSPVVTSLIHEETRLRMERVSEALENKDYNEFYSEVLEAWSRERLAYTEIRNIIKDVIGTGVFYSILILPFIALSERFLFGVAGIIKRLVRMAVMFGILMVIFYFLHPGLRMASNLFMVISGFFLVILLLPGLFILITSIISILKKTRVTLLGSHFAETSRGSQLLTIFAIGIENLKRRKLRSILNLTTIVMLVFALVALTSMSSFRITTPYEFSGTTIYNGFLVKAARPTDITQSIITTQVIDYFEAKYNEPNIICPRAYLYHPGGSNVYFTVLGPNGEQAFVRAGIGLSTKEPEVTHLDSALIEGIWFSLDDERSCILPVNVASKLNVKLNDEVVFQGLKLRVRGIFDSNIYSVMLDLDQNLISPITGGGQQGVVTRIAPSDLIVLPYALARKLGAGSNSVAIMISDENAVLELAQQLADTFPGLFMRVGINGKIVSFFSDEVSTFTGWQMLVVPLVIAAFTMTNVLLGSVYERTKEIGIYASLGLSPQQVSLMFLGESSLYAAMGSVLGYVLGLFVNGLVRGFQLLPEEVAPNIASSWLITSIGVSIVATFLATLYPMLKASKLVTPSLERAWKIPTKPTGDDWEIPLPYELQNREVDGVMAFLYEFFQANTTEGSSSFWVRNLKLTERQEQETSIKALEMIARIVPYEANIEQECGVLFMERTNSDRNTVTLHIRRIYGILNTWKHSNRAFVDQIRKQLLLWRSLRPAERDRYIQSAHDVLNK